MKHHAQPSMGYNPNLVIIHAGTNLLRGNKTPEVANQIIELATTLKTDNNEIVISSFMLRRQHLREKVKNVNVVLTTKTTTLGIGFIRHTNIDG